MCYFILQYSCCGATNYRDFENKGTWKTNDQRNGITNILLPVVCCRNIPPNAAETAKCAGNTGDINYDTLLEIQSESRLYDVQRPNFFVNFIYLYLSQ